MRLAIIIIADDGLGCGASEIVVGPSPSTTEGWVARKAPAVSTVRPSSGESVVSGTIQACDEDVRGTNPNCGIDAVVTGASLLADGIEPPVIGVTVPFAVSTPKLPYHVPKTLIKRTPNQSDRLKLLVLILAMFAEAVALPLVALPARVLP
jgi:hypothetical protein